MIDNCIGYEKAHVTMYACGRGIRGCRSKVESQRISALNGCALKLRVGFPSRRTVCAKGQSYNVLVHSGNGIVSWVAGRGRFMVRGETQKI